LEVGPQGGAGLVQACAERALASAEAQGDLALRQISEGLVAFVRRVAATSCHPHAPRVPAAALRRWVVGDA
jgi:hypothetical protein